MQIRPWHPSDYQDVCRVCIATGDNGTDARGLYRDEWLMGLYWALPYAVRDSRLAIVVEMEEGDELADGLRVLPGDGARVCGYILGSDDVVAYRRWLAANWLPALRRRYPPSKRLSSAETWLRGEIARDPDFENEWPEYPGELHIDLLPCLQGKGLGRRLMDAFAQQLQSLGCPGYHLGVSRANTGAMAFYRKYGLTELGGDTETAWFDRLL